MVEAAALLAINLKTAKALGLTVFNQMRLLADEVIRRRANWSLNLAQ
jgi:hypothetical protein